MAYLSSTRSSDGTPPLGEPQLHKFLSPSEGLTRLLLSTCRREPLAAAQLWPFKVGARANAPMLVRMGTWDVPSPLALRVDVQHLNWGCRDRQAACHVPHV